MSRALDFDRFYADSRARLLLFLYAYCGDAEAASDAVDEAFVAVVRRWRRLSADGRSAEAWLRARAIRQVEHRPHALREGSARRRAVAIVSSVSSGADKTRMLVGLQALDPISRRLLLVRRLAGIDLPAAAAEVGLTESGAEQALARVTNTLHAAKIDTTPAGLEEALHRLTDDLTGRPVPVPLVVRRTAARRRAGRATVAAVAIAAIVAEAGTLAGIGPFARVHRPAAAHLLPASGPVPRRPAQRPAGVVGPEDLLAADVLTSTSPQRTWRVLGAARSVDRRESIYGPCMMAADDPPPHTSWGRLYAPAGTSRVRGDVPLRQVLFEAPSAAEAQRAFHRLVLGFTDCAGRRLVGYRNVEGLGDRARAVTLRTRAAPTGGQRGTQKRRADDQRPVVRQTVIIARTGSAVTVLSATGTSSRPSRRLLPTLTELTELTATTVNLACSALHTTCASSPQTSTARRPPAGD